jgi:hypothetical protein
LICRAGVASEVWCSCGVEIFASSFESSSSAVYVLVEVIIATCCSVQAYAIQVLAMLVQICTHAGEACVEMFALVWRHSEHPPSFGFFCRKQRLSTAASHKTVPIHRNCIEGRRVGYRVRARRCPVWRKSAAQSHSRSQVCSYTSSNAAQLCICLQAVLTGPWLLVSDCRSARSWSQSNISSWPGVDTNSKAGGATHGRFRAWQEHFRQFAW